MCTGPSLHGYEDSACGCLYDQCNVLNLSSCVLNGRVTRKQSVLPMTMESLRMVALEWDRHQPALDQDLLSHTGEDCLHCTFCNRKIAGDT